MITPRRILPVAMVLAFIATGIVLVDLGFRLSDRLWPQWLPPSRVGTGYYDLMERRIAAAEHQIANRIVDPELPLSVLIGQSTLQSGVSTTVLNREDGIDCLHLMLGGAGGALQLFVRGLDPIRRSALKPDTIVLGLHYFFLVSDATQLGGTNMPETVEPERQWSAPIKRFFQDRSWTAARRRDFTNEIDWRFLGMRVRLGDLLGDFLPGQSFASIDPWAHGHHDEFALKTNSNLEELMQKSARLYAHPPEAYSRNPENIADLIDSIRWLRRRDTIVIILIQPENSVLRAATPPEAHVALVDPIRSAFPGPGVEILDLNDLLPDHVFSDSVHYTAQGREMLSRELAIRIAEVLRHYGRLPET